MNALRYIDKNSADCERKFFECLDKTAYEVENSLYAYYSIRSNRKLISIPMYEILYFEVLDHDLIVHTASGIFKERKTIAELKKDLPKQFVQIGRSHIVNVLQVDRLTTKEPILRDGTALRLLRSIHPDYMRRSLQ